MNIAPRIKDAADAAVNTLMREIKGVKAVVIATEDGLELAARAENTAQVARMSAIASSLAALGAVAGVESGLGQCENVAIETASGHILMLQARHAEVDLIVSVITGKDAVIGQVLYLSKLATLALQRA
ncbi:roadblock/LC7 domain-containing protein [Variovorax sp. W2I14]|jgi:predicted regulator of Ras-like GTPase activity (Roadblock/LC7/MglB family)|uniref:roadblock/LC7 domain-containing protein n=1 Tax=Variovorax sp. W2I14 TaxID=3042290 RepID=UPI003D236BDA